PLRVRRDPFLASLCFTPTCVEPNRIRPQGRSRETAQFQSLIGRAQTQMAWKSRWSMKGFQSLIGRAQTLGASVRRGPLMPFQSLIGRAQTLNDSIPSRAANSFRSLIGRAQTGERAGRMAHT